VRTCVLFDLDDTLYAEADYVRSGFAAVAREVEARLGVPAPEVAAALDRALQRHGRGRTIDLALEELGIVRPHLVADLVKLYRGHSPSLQLYPDARRTLDRLSTQGLKLGLITDGDPTAQRHKARALGLERWLAYLGFTWEEGPEQQKPDPRVYQRALQALQATPEEAVYVGDNPTKDFSGARQVGLFTVRLLRGPYGNREVPEKTRANVDIRELDDLDGAAHLSTVLSPRR
jgi:putative hydrolase of the HAD superfamily